MLYGWILFFCRFATVPGFKYFRWYQTLMKNIYNMNDIGRISILTKLIQINAHGIRIKFTTKIITLINPTNMLVILKYVFI